MRIHDCARSDHDFLVVLLSVLKVPVDQRQQEALTKVVIVLSGSAAIANGEMNRQLGFAAKCDVWEELIEPQFNCASYFINPVARAGSQRLGGELLNQGYHVYFAGNNLALASAASGLLKISAFGLTQELALMPAGITPL